MAMEYCQVSTLISILFVVTLSQTSGITIDTRLGRIEGITAVVNNVNIHQFLGVPFAKPPIGTLRFQKPQPYGNWTGTLRATEFGPSCMQYIRENDKRLIPNLNITEDCLQLNVFVPRNISKQNNLTVMVWVHGGGFTDGQGTMFNSSYLVSLTDVIVVTINYRLNVFGFLYAGHDTSYKGHYGLFDQQLAFKWVKDNIEDFGGNPNSITIFGESVGGISVTLQSILPSNLGLFHRVIAESGSIIKSADINGTDTLTLMKKTAKLLNCSNPTVEETIKCLQSVNASYLMAKYHEAMPSRFRFSFTPGGELLNETLFSDLKNKGSLTFQMFQNIDIMAGNNVGEAGLEYLDLDGHQKAWKFNVSLGIPENILCDHVIPAISKDLIRACDDLTVAICHNYLQNLTASASLQDQTQAAADLYADASLHYPTYHLLRLHSNATSNRTYLYSFSHKPMWELIPDRPAWLRGPNHASELAFVFGLKDWYPKNVTSSSAELELSHSMMVMWTNFAKYGNPNFANDTQWKTFDQRNQNYMGLDIPLTPGVSLYGHRMRFWNEEVPRVVGACRDGTYVVTTSIGKIRGLVTEVDSHKILQFRKIPYAMPPVKNLRFAKPVPITPWEGTLDSTIFGPSCIQFLDKNNPRLPNVNMSEDCLYLNIYVPFPVRQSSRKAVMIWIHGGGFTGGQGTSLDGSRLALKGDVIVVTINYRLNIFGFLSTGSSNIKGNYGLYDQQLAIRWVNEYILSFGGDPNRITLFGNSAGGVSTTLQGVIPSNKGLFQRVIAESGSFLARRDYQSKTIETSKQVNEKLQCPSAPDTEMLKCLRSKNATDLLNNWLHIAWNHSGIYSMTTSIGPITDGELIPESPDSAIINSKSPMNRQFSSIDLLVGTNTADSVLLYFNLQPYASRFKFNISEGIPTRIVCDEMAPAIVREIFEIKCPALIAAICKQYTPKQSVTLQDQSQMAADLYGDFLEDVPTIKSLNSHSLSARSTFQYLFSHRPNWEVIGEHPSWLRGANHASEIPFVFGLKTFYPPNVKITPEEQTLEDQIMEYWTNFAKFGNPNGNSKGSWKSYNLIEKEYNNLDLNITMSSMLYKNRVDFWMSAVPNIVKSCHSQSVNSAHSIHANISLFVGFITVIIRRLRY